MLFRIGREFNADHGFITDAADHPQAIVDDREEAVLHHGQRPEGDGDEQNEPENGSAETIHDVKGDLIVRRFGVVPQHDSPRIGRNVRWLFRDSL
jgi:hypothetical protein